MKNLAWLVILFGISFTSNARDLKIDLGDIEEFEIMVSCPSEYNNGEVSSMSIIENFQVIGSNEEQRLKKSGCQSHQSYPLFVEGNELHMWVKWIDGSSDDEDRYARMREHGSIALGTLSSNQLPACGSNWYTKIKVKAISGLSIVENIKKRESGSYTHNLTIKDGKNEIETVGWVTAKPRSNRREDRFCYFRK